MDKTPYLLRLADRLAAGAQAFDAAFRTRHAEYVLARQRPDGGWAGRDGDSDLYYTSFAIRSLALLERMDEAAVARACDYLHAQAGAIANIVDLLSWLSTALALQAAGGREIVSGDDDWAAGIAGWLESFRRSDGGFAKGGGGTSGSTYHTFLALLCFEFLGRTPTNTHVLPSFFRERQREDGGFVEIPQATLSGVNPTAAAFAGWQIVEAPPTETIQGVADYLESVKSDEGGLQANARIPFADGLSTFTGLLTALDAGIADGFDMRGIAEYVRSLEEHTGGFHGAAWDRQTDVEYTFYSLGSLALLAQR